LSSRFDRATIHRFTGLGFIGLIQLRQVAGNALVQFFLLALELFQVQVAACGGYRLELTAIDGHPLARDQSHFAAELYEGSTGSSERLAIVLAVIGNGLEVRLESIEQPHDFDIALAFGFETARGTNTLEIAIQVQLQQICRVVGRTPRAFGNRSSKPELLEV
jgi:hypothetical protein